MAQVIHGFEQMSAMKHLSKSMKELLEVVEKANEIYKGVNDTSLENPVSRLRETVSVIEDTETMIKKYHKGEITLEELESFRDKVAAMRP